MTVNIMFDLETWGTTPGSDIRSIGAVVFDPIDGMVYSKPGAGADPFYIATDNPIGIWRNGDFEPGVVIGKERRKYLDLTRDPLTVQWWNDQSPEAQSAFVNPVDLHKACQLFTSWICNLVPVAPTTQPPDINLWANHSHFDVPILAAVFRAVGLPQPWHFRAPKDMPTIVEPVMTRDEYCNYGVAHNALDDAIAQAMTVCEAYKRLGLQR